MSLGDPAFSPRVCAQERVAGVRAAAFTWMSPRSARVSVCSRLATALFSKGVGGWCIGVKSGGCHRDASRYSSFPCHVRLGLCPMGTQGLRFTSLLFMCPLSRGLGHGGHSTCAHIPHKSMSTWPPQLVWRVDVRTERWPCCRPHLFLRGDSSPLVPSRPLLQR